MTGGRVPHSGLVHEILAGQNIPLEKIESDKTNIGRAIRIKYLFDEIKRFKYSNS